MEMKILGRLEGPSCDRVRKNRRPTMDMNPPLTVREVAEAIFRDDAQRRNFLAFACAKFGIQKLEAEDIVQEMALDLLRQQGYVRNPKAFAFTVFRARCCRFVEARRRSRHVFADGDFRIEEKAMPVGAEFFDQVIALRQALGAISPSCVRLLAAYYVEGVSFKEAARRLSLADSSVSKTINRCLKKLKRCLS